MPGPSLTRSLVILEYPLNCKRMRALLCELKCHESYMFRYLAKLRADLRLEVIRRERR